MLSLIDNTYSTYREIFHYGGLDCQPYIIRTVVHAGIHLFVVWSYKSRETLELLLGQ